jgi:hypothetical protein
VKNSAVQHQRWNGLDTVALGFADSRRGFTEVYDFNLITLLVKRGQYLLLCTDADGTTGVVKRGFAHFGYLLID